MGGVDRSVAVGNEGCVNVEIDRLRPLKRVMRGVASGPTSVQWSLRRTREVLGEVKGGFERVIRGVIGGARTALPRRRP
jgi:hypothetical protein